MPAIAIVRRVESLFPAPLLPFWGGVPAIAVGHPASWACLGSWSVRFRSEPSGFVPVKAIPSLPFQSRALAVDHPLASGHRASCTKSCRSFALGPLARASDFSGSVVPAPAEPFAVAVGQPDKVLTLSDVDSADSKSLISPLGKGSHVPGNQGIGTKAYGPFQAPGFGAAPPDQPKARSAGNDRPSGVANSVQISRYKIVPPEAVFACNLLAKDDVRAALIDEPVPVRPKVPLVSKSIS